MRQNFNLNKKRLEEAKKKKREEKRLKKLNKASGAPVSEPQGQEGPVSTTF